MATVERPPRTEEDVAKDKVVKKFSDAATPAEKAAVVEEVAKEVRDVTSTTSENAKIADEYQEANKGKVAAVLAEVKDAKTALNTLFTVIKLATYTPGALPPTLNPNSVFLINKIDDEVSRSLIEADVPAIYNFVQKALQKDLSEVELTEEWEKLRKKASKKTLENMAEALVITAANGRLATGTVDRARATTLFEIKKEDGRIESRDKSTEEGLPPEDLLGSVFGNKNIMRGLPALRDEATLPNGVTFKEKATYDAWNAQYEAQIAAKKAEIFKVLPEGTPQPEIDIQREKEDIFEHNLREMDNARRDGQLDKFNDKAEYFEIKLLSPNLAALKNEEAHQKYIEFYARDLANNKSKDNFLVKFGLTLQDFDKLQPNYIYSNFGQYFEEKDKKLILRLDKKKEMYSTIYQVMNRLLSRTTAAPDSAAAAFSNERQLDSSINQLLWNIVEDPRIRSKLGEDSYSSFRDFITNTFMEARQEERKIRNIYQDIVVQIIEGNTDPKGVAGKMKQYRAHEINYVLKGYKSTLTQLAVSEFERDLQNRIAVKNGGYLPNDLFAVNKPDLYRDYQYDDVQRVKENFYERIKQMYADENLRNKLKETAEGREMLKDIDGVQQWEVDRAINIAMGVSFVNSMRGHDIIAMGKPPQNFAGLFPFAQYFSIDKKWRLGRGGEQWKTSEMLQLEVRMKEDKRGLGDRIKKGWVPVELYEKGRSSERMKMQELIEKLNHSSLKLAQSEEDHVFLADLLRQFSTFSLFTQGGWRIAALGDWYSEKFKQKMGKDWRAAYTNLQEQVGAGARFFYDNGRVTDEVKDYILKKKFGPNYENEQRPDVLEAVFAEYTLMPTKGKLNEKEMFKYNNDDKENNLTTHEFIEEKSTFYRGMNFLALMERSPYDFMLNMVQLEPELANTVTIQGDFPGKDGRKELTAWEFYFDKSVEPYLNPAELAKRNDFRKRIQDRWTDPKVKESTDNINHLSKLAEIWHKVYTNNNFKKTQKQPDGGTKLVLDKGGAADKFYKIMTMAADKVKLTDQPKMRAEHIEYKDVHTGEIDPASRDVAELMFGDHGMVTHFKGLGEKFADGPGEESKVGDRKFFYTVAKRWFEYDQRGVMPNTNDIKVGPMFETIGKHEEEAYSRMWGSNASWNEAVNGITDFDNILLRAAGSKSMSEIMELHKKIQSLEGSLGVTGAHRVNYILATAVVRFFQQDYRARFPFPLSIFTSANLEKEISISVKHKSASAMQFTQEDIREYMDSLLAAGYIGKDGYWTREMLELSVGADREKYLLLTAGPSIVFLTGAFVFLKFFMDAFSTYGPGGGKKK